MKKQPLSKVIITNNNIKKIAYTAKYDDDFSVLRIDIKEVKGK